jgi:plasmid stabilization system protein ParE
MKSGFNIEWSDEALHNLDAIIEYLTFKWTEREKRNFFKKLEKQLQIISQKPLAYPKSDLNSNIRRCVLSSQTAIYYEIKEKKTTIISLFDNRKSPNVIKNLIE